MEEQNNNTPKPGTSSDNAADNVANNQVEQAAQAVAAARQVEQAAQAVAAARHVEQAAQAVAAARHVEPRQFSPALIADPEVFEMPRREPPKLRRKQPPHVPTTYDGFMKLFRLRMNIFYITEDCPARRDAEIEFNRGVEAFKEEKKKRDSDDDDQDRPKLAPLRI